MALEAILSLLVALSFIYGIITHNKNKKLTESLELAQNNVQAYQELVNNSQQANSVLQLQLQDFKNSKDKEIQDLLQRIKDNNINVKHVSTTETQHQSIVVSKSQNKNIPLAKDTVISDSIIYNIYTRLYYNIYKDSISTKLDIHNKQDLIVYSKKEYKNKKSFIKRLFTLDFKKVTKYKYKIINSNDLIKSDSVRVIQIK